MNKSTGFSLNIFPRVSTLALSFSLFLLILAGCSAVQDVTGYFNTYYNTKKLYTETVDELSKSAQKERDTNYFAAYAVNKSVADKFDKVIEKGSKIIQFYPASSWVDDAILMIAKSYVYQGESESAIRKFDELLTNFPESDLRFEAELWYARAQYYSGRDEVVLATIDGFTPKAIEAGESDMAIEGLMLAAQVNIDRQEFAFAVPRLEQALDIPGDSRLKARAQFSLAECFDRLGNDSSAAIAYGRVNDYSPDPKASFQAKLRHGMRLSAIGHHDEAFDRFDELSDEDLLTEERGLVEVEVARTFLALDDTAKAFPLFNYIDTTYKRTDPAARSMFFRGELFEKHYRDYAQAGLLYDKARTENTSSSVAPQAKRGADNMAKYVLLRANLARYDTLLQRALNPDTTLRSRDSLLTDAAVYKDTSASAAVKQDEAVQTPETDSPPPEAVKEGRDMVGDITDPDRFFLGEEEPPKRGFLHRGGAGGASRASGNNDLTPGRTDERAAGSGRGAELPGARFAAGMRVPSDAAKLTPDSLKALMRENRFELAGLFLLELEIPESAKVWYTAIIEDSIDSFFKPRALYALAEIYRAEDDSARVDSIYDVLVASYPETEYGRHTRRLRGLVVSDSTVDEGVLAYANAAQLLTSGDTSGAMKAFKTVATRFPGTSSGIKARYTTGWIFENLLLQNDSAAAWYQVLVDSFPNSEYAAVAKPKLAVREKPESLSQYVRIKEIQAVPKSTGGGRASSPQGQLRGDTDMNRNDFPSPTQGRGRGTTKTADENIDEDVDQPDEPEQDEPDPPEEEEPEDDGGGGL